MTEPTTPCPECDGSGWKHDESVERVTACHFCNSEGEKPEMNDESDEAEMLAFIQLLKESLKADIRREMDAAIAEDAEFDCAVNVPRDQLRALQLLLSRYQSQQERIKELEEACADLDEARIAMFNEREALAAQLAVVHELFETLKVDATMEVKNDYQDGTRDSYRDVVQRLKRSLKSSSGAELLAKLERLTAERDGWKRTAFQLGGVVQENTSLKASQEPPQNDFDYNSPPFQSAGKRMVSAAAVEPMTDEEVAVFERGAPLNSLRLFKQVVEGFERDAHRGRRYLAHPKVAARLAAEEMTEG